MKRYPRLIVLLFLTLIPRPLSLFAQGTAFTYQGRLNDGASAANGNYDLRFAIYDSADSPGTLIAGPQTNASTVVSNGLFTATLDFGGGVFTGNPRWLEIGVRQTGGGDFTMLSPRQRLAPAPYALYAPSAGVATIANDVSPSTILHGQALQVGVNNSVTVTTATIAGGGNNTAGGPYDSIGGGLQNTAAGVSTSIGGGSGNRALGDYATVAGGENNSALGPHAFVGGGRGNSASGYDVVGGGLFNSVTADKSGIGSGLGNQVSGLASWIGGGQTNSAVGNYCVIGGGYANTNNSIYGTLGGGQNNVIQPNSIFATIAGGQQNIIGANAGAATIAGGFVNTIESGAVPSTIAGGNGNRVQSGATYCAMGGGLFNTIQTSAAYSAIGGGGGNTIQINTPYSTIGGGAGNTIQTNSIYSTVAGGKNNVVSDYAFATSTYAVIAGGEGNTVAPDFQFEGYGPGDHSAIGGGYSNAVWGIQSVISGGANNLVFGGDWSAIPGGQYNEADGNWSFAAGQRAKAYHTGSFVWADSQPANFASTTNDQFNIRAKGGVRLSSGTSLQWSSGGALVDNQGGSIELGDSFQSAKIPFIDFHYGIGSAQDYNVRIINDGTEQLTIARYGSVTPMARLYPGGMTVNGAVALTSDRNEKENFMQVDAGDVLAKVAALPLSKWNYKEDTRSMHIGPMAQDFYAAFGVGPDDKHIATVDADGVALAAIQGLNEKVEVGNQKSEAMIKILEAENAELKRRLEKVERLLDQKSGGAN